MLFRSPIYDRRKPPVGAMELHERKDGSVDFAAETQDGLMGLRAGSRSLSDLPYGIPVYPGAQVKQSNTLSGPAVMPGKLLEYTSYDPRAKILAWYREQVRQALLKTVTDAEIGSQWVIEAGYPDGRDGGFHLSVTKGPKGGSRVLLTTGFGENYMVEAPDAQAYIDGLLANSSNALVNLDEAN